MSTASYGGMTGSVVTTDGTVSEVKNWTCKRSVKVGDATSMASNGFVERIALMKGGDFSWESLQVIGTVGEVVSVTLKTKATGGISYQAAAVITKISDTTDVKGVVTFKTEGKLSGIIIIGV